MIHLKSENNPKILLFRKIEVHYKFKNIKKISKEIGLSTKINVSINLMKSLHSITIILLIFSIYNSSMLSIPLNNSFIDITDFDFTISSGESFLEVKFCYSIPENEKISSSILYLSLDNMTFKNNGESNLFVEESHCLFSKSGGFWRSNAIGDPFPFDMKKGNILYGYIEITTNLTSYISKTTSVTIPDDITVPLWSIIAGMQNYIIIGVVIISFFLLLLIFYVRRKR